jgi:hypothetical protein
MARPRALTFGIQICVQLIETIQERVAKDGPRKANSLTLTWRQRHPAWPIRLRILCARMMSCTPDPGGLQIASDVARSSKPQMFSATVPSNKATS